MRRERAGALHRFRDHRLESLSDLRVGNGLRKMRLVAEDEVEREHAGLRRERRGVRGRGDDEIDVAGTHLLQHHRLLAELRERKLIDRELAAGELLELRVEHVRRVAVAGRFRLVVAEGELALRRGLVERAGGEEHSGAERKGAADLHGPEHSYSSL